MSRSSGRSRGGKTTLVGPAAQYPFPESMETSTLGPGARKALRTARYGAANRLGDAPMHARLITAQFPTEGLAAGEARVREAAGKMRKLPGNRGRMIMVDRDSGKMVAVTLWEDLEAVRASEEAGSAERAESAKAGSGQVVGVEPFEVSFLEIPEDANAGREDF